MDRSVLGGVDGATLVDGLTDNVDDSAESLGADGHHNGVAGVVDLLATHETFRGVQSDGAHVVATQMLGDLEHKAVLSALNLEGVENRRKGSFELHVHDGTDDLGDLSVSRSGSAEATYMQN